MSEMRKVAGYFPVSREMLLDHGLVEPTTEELQDIKKSRAEMEQRRRAATAAWPTFVADLAAVTNPLARVVIGLHKADERGDCEGCEFGGYEAEPPGWPCRTTIVVAAAIGISVPKDLHLAEQYRDW